MKYAVVGARILLGLTFLLFGLNYFFQFAQLPGPEEVPAQGFFEALVETGYMLPLIKGTETLCGALLVLGLFVPLALTVLAPVIVNIALFHVFLAPSGVPIAAGLVLFELFLVWQYRTSFLPVLHPFARTSASRLATPRR